MNRVGIVVAMVAEARSLTREHIATEVPIPLREENEFRLDVKELKKLINSLYCILDVE